MRILVDGHNAMGALNVGGKTHEARRRNLLRRVAEVAPQATVFFDARRAPPGLDTGSELGVSVRYCRGREADAEILEIVRASAAPGQITVVTNDREVAGKASQLGARALGVREFFGPRSPVRPPAPGRPPRKPEFTPQDFGLPDEIDLSDPDGEY
jgi:predicted RNA-binding protein with PIN domain